MAKTGTTALFCNIRDHLPGDVRLFFEPGSVADWEALRLAPTTTLTKALMATFQASGMDPAFFQRIVVLVRDPRDQFLSRLLYWAAQLSKRHPNLRAAILDVILAKEADPAGIPFLDLVAQVAALDSQHEFFPRNAVAEFGMRLRDAAVYFPALKGSYILKYEDMTDGRMQGVRDYLQLELADRATVPHEWKRVERSRSHGEWKRWFVDSDMKTLAPLIAEYLAVFGYESAPGLTEGLGIEATTSSGFIRKSWDLP